MHAGVALPEERVVPLGLDDRLADGAGEVEELVLAEVRRDPVRADLVDVAVVRRELSPALAADHYTERREYVRCRR